MPILKSIAANKKVKDKVYTQTPASLKRILEYVTRKGKDQSEVYKAYGVGLSDNIDIAFKEIMFNKRAFDKIDGRQYKHYAISYPPGFNDLETIEKIATQFVEENFLKRGFKCYVAIHTDKDHYHTHIITDSVNFVNGYKLQEFDEKQLLKSRYKDKELNTWEVRLEELKTSLEEISLEYGVPSPERSLGKAKTKNIGKMAKYKALEKDNSWRNHVAKTWEEVILETTTTMENLEQKLKEKGIYFNRINYETKSLTLATEYEVKGERKKGKIRLNKLATEEDYRFQTGENIYNWDTFMKILEKHREKETEELKRDLKTFNYEVSKDADREKELEFTISSEKEIEKDIPKTEKEWRDELIKLLEKEHNKKRLTLEQIQEVFKPVENKENKYIIDYTIKALKEDLLEDDGTVILSDIGSALRTVLPLIKIKENKIEIIDESDYTFEYKHKEEKELNYKDFISILSINKKEEKDEDQETEEKVEEKKPQEKVVVQDPVQKIKKKKTLMELKEDIYKFIESKGDLILLDAVNLLEDYKTTENREIIDYIIKVLPSIVENVDGYKTVVAEDFKYNIEKKLEDTRVQEIQKEVPKFFRKSMDFTKEK